MPPSTFFYLLPSIPEFFKNYFFITICQQLILLRIRERASFKTITKWNTETSENVIKSEEDVFAENAKWSLGIMAALGGLYLGKKFLKK